MYARLYIAGKEKWVSLGTSVLEVAKVKMVEEKSAIRTARRDGWAPVRGTISVQLAIDGYRDRLKNRVSLKESTRQYYQWVLDSILTSWPELVSLDVRKVDARMCEGWAARYAAEYSASYYNGAVVVLGNIFKVAIDAGIIWRTPTAGLERATEVEKALRLPTLAEFAGLVHFARSRRHRTAGNAADLIEFLAYTGLRIGEAGQAEWRDWDVSSGTLTVRGDPDTATKNWRIRKIPLIAEAIILLTRIRSERSDEPPGKLVLQVHDVRGTFEAYAKHTGRSAYGHHDMRHFFITRCVESGVDAPTIAEWVGHQDGGKLIYERYFHAREEHGVRCAQLVSFTPPPPTG